MELQQYINSHTNYIKIARENNFKVKTYKGLKILSYSYDSPISEDLSWAMFCKGAVISPDNKIICLGPVRASAVQEHEHEEGDTYEHLIDGTMINLFHYNGEWIISTRSEIGGYNKWNGKKSFRELFDECSKLDMVTLPKDLSYSFVMRHTENRNVSPITDNELILCEAYDYSNDTIRRIHPSEFPDNIYTKTISYDNKEEFMKMYQGPVIDYATKGYTIKRGSHRYKWINPYFDEIKNLKINMNNHMLNYIELRHNGNLSKYLRYYPEHKHLFNNYKEKIHTFTNDLYSCYKNTFIHKTSEKSEIPYHMKPLIYEIHKKYLDTKQPTSWQDTKDYIHNVPSKKLTFALNYC